MNEQEARPLSETLGSQTETGSTAAILPIEPVPPWEREETEYDGTATYAALREFHVYGRREPHAIPDKGASRPLPALLHQYRDLAATRYDYPVCIPERPDMSVRTLTAIFDNILARIAEDGEDGDRIRNHVLRLESEIRRHSSEHPGSTLVESWDACEPKIIKLALSEDGQRLRRESLQAAREALVHDGLLLACASDTPRQIFLAVLAARWDAQCRRYRDDLEALVARTRDILAADDSNAADLHSPEHLRNATGGADMDFEAMSSLLKESHLAEPLPETRRARIERALDVILEVKPLFDGSVSLFDTSARLPFDLEPVRNVCARVVDRHDSRLRAMVAFFKALRVVELEVENGYRERVHDRFFAQFEAVDLTDEERSLFPPPVLLLDDEFFASPDLTGLIDLLSAGLGVNVLVAVSDLDYAEKREPTATPGWPARLAGMVAALGDVFVMQAPASQPAHIASGVAAGFEYGGAALCSVYTGNEMSQSGLPAYLAAAAVAESRLFPVWRYDPRGGTLAECMSIAGNAQLERLWTIDEFVYQTEDGGKHSADLVFTPADFLSMDIRFDDHFWCVASSAWHKEMLPLGEYLQTDDTEAGRRIPYLHAVDADGQVVRVVVTRAIVDVVRRVGRLWNGVRESGGIDNSFAHAARDSERERMDEEKQRDLSKLTMEIAGRIVTRLIAMGDGASADSFLAGGVPAFGSAPLPALSDPGQEAAPAGTSSGAPAGDDQEVEAGAPIDDPYIDTPLCTSCNECTKINGQLFDYDENKQAFIKDAGAGTFRELVTAAERCPVRIIHPGKPRNSSERGLDKLVKRAAAFN